MSTVEIRRLLFNVDFGLPQANRMDSGAQARAAVAPSVEPKRKGLSFGVAGHPLESDIQKLFLGPKKYIVLCIVHMSSLY